MPSPEISKPFKANPKPTFSLLVKAVMVQY